MLFVLYHNSGVHSGRSLKTSLRELSGGDVLGGYPGRFKRLFSKRPAPKLVINLGCTESIDYDGQILNARDMVRAASNKKRARAAFRDAGVPAPSLFLRAQDISKADLPVIARTSYHKKGEGFWFCKTLANVRGAVDAGATHFLGFVPKTREYRVHLFSKTRALGQSERKPEDYVSIKLAEKVWQGKGQPDPNTPQKNHEFGWTFLAQQNRREDELGIVRHVARQAISTLNMDFGAVDVMYETRTKRPYVLEVNSSPSLANEVADTCETYAKRVLRIVQGDKKNGKVQ